MNTTVTQSMWKQVKSALEPPGQCRRRCGVACPAHQHQDSSLLMTPPSILREEGQDGTGEPSHTWGLRE